VVLEAAEDALELVIGQVFAADEDFADIVHAGVALAAVECGWPQGVSIP
jgi:hypothetical protein